MTISTTSLTRAAAVAVATSGTAVGDVSRMQILNDVDVTYILGETLRDRALSGLGSVRGGPRRSCRSEP